jgi:hypothetical protein
MEQQMQMEEAAMAEIFDDEEENKQNEAKEAAIREIEQRHGVYRVQDLIATFITDYADLEKRYVRDCAKKEQKIHELEDQNMDLKSSIAVLESRLASTNKQVKFALTKPTNCPLRQRINHLEQTNKRLLHQHNQMKKQLQELEAQRDVFVSTHEVNTRTPEEARRKTFESSFASHEQRQERYIIELQSERKVMQQKLAIVKMEAITSQLRSFLPIHDAAHTKTDSLLQNDEQHLHSSPKGQITSFTDSLHDVATHEKLLQQIQELKQSLKARDHELLEQKKSFELREKGWSAHISEAIRVSRETFHEGRVHFFM